MMELPIALSSHAPGPNPPKTRNSVTASFPNDPARSQSHTTRNPNPSHVSLAAFDVRSSNMSGVEVIAFIIGLEPLLIRGQELIERFRTFQNNRTTAPALRSSFTTFAADLHDSIARLENSSETLPEQSRNIIAADITLLQTSLSDARSLAERVTKRLFSNRITQFVRAKAQAADCDALTECLEKARSLVQNANKYLDLTTTLHQIRENVPDKLVDKFRPHFPISNRSSSQVVLDFDSTDDDGNPKTTEARIKKRILEMGRGPGRVVTIHGGAGVGKSTILESLAYEDHVRQMFPDGVHVVKLGMDARKATIFQVLCRVLRESGAQKTEEALRVNNNLEEALNALTRFFRDKRCALFIDDVWSSNVGIGPFFKLCEAARGEGSMAVLMTTREHSIAALAPRKNIFQLAPREPLGAEARRILLLHADCIEQQAVSCLFEKSIEQVLSICNGLPVCLAAAGKGVKMMGLSQLIPQHVAWERYVQNLLSYREQLITEDIGEYGNLLATFAASVSILDERRVQLLGLDTRLSFAQLYRRLCVLLKQDRVPSTVLKHLWGVKTDAIAERIAINFVEVGLASSSHEMIGSVWVWRLSMHDSLHDYAVMMAQRSGDFKIAHEELLNAYEASHPAVSCEEGESNWWPNGLAPDGYVHENLCRLLAAVGRDTDLLRLILTPQWTARQLELSGMMKLEADFLLCIGIVQNQCVVEKEVQLEALNLILGAVWLSSGFVMRNPAEIWFQLPGRLRHYAETNVVVAEYLRRIDLMAPMPYLKDLSSLLLSPGGATIKMVTAESSIRCLTVWEQERIICGCSDGRVITVDFERGCILTEWQAHDKAVLSVAFLNGRVATGSEDQIAKVWDLETRVCLMTLEGHTGWITSVVFAGLERLVSGSTDGTVRLWDLSREALEKSMVSSGVISCVWCVAVLPDRDHVVSGRADNTIEMWNLSSGRQVRVMEMHNDWVTSVAVTPDGRFVVTGSNDGTVRRLNAKVGDLVGEPLAGSRRCVSSIALKGDSSLVASGAHDQMIRVWDLNTGKAVCDPLTGHSDWVTGVSFVNTKLVSCSLDRTIRMWDLDKANEQVNSEHHEWRVTAVNFSPDMKKAVSGSLDSTIRIWDTVTGAPLGQPLNGHRNAVEDVKMMADGRIVSVGRDKTVRLWDSEKMEIIRVMEGHDQRVTCVDVLRNGRVLTGSRDKCLRLWDCDAEGETGEIIFRDKAMLSDVYITSDNLRVVLVPMGDEIRVLDLGTRTVVREVHVEDAWMLGRGEILDLLGEPNDATKVRMVKGSREIRFGGNVIGSLECNIRNWDVRGRKVCVGLDDGQIGFMVLKS